MRHTLTLPLSLCFSVAAFAQMPQPDGSVRYGNEWIDYGADYLRIAVAEDGLYRIGPADLAAAGMAVTAGNRDRFALYHNGELVAVRVTADGIIFVGEQNRSAMDRHLFPDPDKQLLNSRYSLHTDTSAYFLRLLPAAGGSAYTPAEIDGTPTELTSIERQTDVVFSDELVKEYFRSGRSSIYYSHYDEVEGFSNRGRDDLLSPNGTRVTEFDLPLPGADGGTARLTTRFGLGFDFHRQRISVDGNEVATVDTSAWTVVELTRPFSPAGPSATVRYEGVSGDRDKAAVAWASVTYPAVPAYDEFLDALIIPANDSPCRVVLTGLGGAAGAVNAYGAENGTVLTASASDGTANLVFPASDDAQRYYLSVDGQASPAPASPHHFTSVLPDDAQTDYLLLTSRALHGSAVEQTAAYRRSSAGGGYTVHVVDVEDLYEEFGYGIRRHPMAIRNYLTAARRTAPQLQYLFLIGKGREYEDVRTAGQLAGAGATFQLPSFGYPASDNLLTAPLGGVVPQLSTGRLAAIDNEEVGIYLNKLRGVEAQLNLGGQALDDRSWMKTVMHLGGGTSPGEQASIRSGLNQLERTVEETSMGADVVSFFKTSGEPIENSRSDAIFETINNGTAVITFFGHSSTQGFDFSIDNPDNYNNRDKYPLMISLGCYSGDAFTEARSISERFLFLRDKGAVSFAASKGVGYISALRVWGDSLYTVLGQAYYGAGVGDILRENIRKFSGTSNFTVAILLEQFALSGDPAYRVHPRPGPDLLIDPASVRFQPDVVPAQNDDYTMNLRVVNLGRGNLPDSVDLRVRQELPGGEVTDLLTTRVRVPNFDRELTLTLPNQGIPSIGQNRIFATIDAANELGELPAPTAESNNDLVVGGSPGIPLTFIANTAKVAYPPRYAVIGGDVELIASTTNALSPDRAYVVQIATSRDFAAPSVDETISSPGGVVRYTPPITFTDSTTYYWRISPDTATTEGAGYIWSESSFTWLDDQPTDRIDWAMQHQGQTIDGDFKNIRANALNEGWNFTRTVVDFEIVNGRFVNTNVPRLVANGGRVNSAFRFLSRKGISVIVADSLDVTNWAPNPGVGDYNTVPFSDFDRHKNTWDFRVYERSGREGLLRFLEEFVEPGKYVLLYTTQRGSDYEYFNTGWLADSVELGRTLFDALEAQGALQVRNITSLGSVPYAFAFQKDMGRIGEAIALTPEDVVVMEAPLQANWQEGTWSTGFVGPALDWQSFDLRLAGYNVTEVDTVGFRLYGQNPQGVEVLLREEDVAVPQRFDLNVDLSAVSSTDFPRLRAEVDFYDVRERTVATVHHAYFNYSRPADVAVNPRIAYSAADSLNQGEEFNLTVGYENISRQDMDSLRVDLQTIDVNNAVTTFTTRRPPIAAGGADEVSFSVPTAALASDVRVQLRLNPEGDQPEDVLFNNNLNTRLKFGKDVIDPNLRVYYDGRRINDGELVSARPEILIQLRDDNTFLPLNDTSAYVIELTDPLGSRERLNFADERIEFQPATTEANVADIYFRPTLAVDGVYTLTVRAADRTANPAGRLDFRQDFEVLNEQRVANVLTYPNPFTTQTQFVYTLSGAEPPAMFRIQIMTVSGRVVRDIDLLEIEDVRVGTHRTNFAWDGTDEYGDQLANGVYLYRVITSDDSGSALENYDNGTGQFFKNGLGKVVIIR